MALHKRSFETCAIVGVAERVAIATSSIRTMLASLPHRLECSLGPPKPHHARRRPGPSVFAGPNRRAYQRRHLSFAHLLRA
jgi:hypothetical protein